MSGISSPRRAGAAALLTSLLVAGCSTNGMSPSNSVAGGTSPAIQHRAESDGHAQRGGLARAAVHGWMSPQAKSDKNVIFWGDYDSSTITLYSAKGVNGPQLGQITQGLSNPERLFVDTQGSVYATNIGNNTVTAYKPGATSPFLTISDGVDGPTGLTVDAAGTVYVANVDSDTITEYKKGKTSPSVTIDFAAEYLATDANDNLYASGYPNVEKYPKGSTTGSSLNLNIGSPGALEIDKKGNVIVLDESNDNLDYFPAGQTQASKQILIQGFPFGLSLSKNNKTLYISNLVGSPFEIQTIAYPKGTKIKNKLTTNAGDWPLAISPDAALGK